MDNKQRKILFLGVLLLGCLATGWLHESGGAFLNSGRKVQDLAPLVKETHNSSENKARQSKQIEVYVSGAVAEPGIYMLPAGARLTEALEAAGGMTSNANRERVNLAKKLKDGMHVYVPALKEKSAKTSTASMKKNNVQGSSSNINAQQSSLSEVNLGEERQRINLNTATAQELIALPGIGPSMANRILALRRVKSFTRVEDLLQVKGIGQAKLNKLKPYITVE
ncbi:MAG: helix-hairpin-helix domain-containing protein [Phascolarctobacterium sp.]|nr:helix-hairpin-helix domain-containing protein [Phascolarctobacterium sp.]